MEDDVAFKLLSLVILLALSGFFSGSEASLFSLTNLHLHKIREDNLPTSGFIQKLLCHPRRLLITILVGNEGVNIALSVIITSIFIALLGPGGKWFAIAVGTMLLLIIGEAIPKTLAVTYPISFSSAVSIPLRLLSSVLYPVVRFFETISNIFIIFFKTSDSREDTSVTENEFISLVETGHREGTIKRTEMDLIHRVFDLADTAVSEIMTPRVDMFCLPMDMPQEKIRAAIIASRHSRVPVYGDSKDDIVGILNTKHLLSKFFNGGSITPLSIILEKPYFVPMEKPVDDMLRKFQLKKTQIAIVVDEYGGVAGVVSLHDILERLLGSIRYSTGTTEEMFHEISDSRFTVSGMMPAEKFNERIGREMIPGDFETVGGFVLHLFGNIPLVGDSISCDGFVFTVEKTGKTRILRIGVSSLRGNDDE